MQKVNLEVLDPTGGPIPKRKTRSPRLTAFEGKRVGLVWNRKPNGDILLEEVGKLLKERYPSVTILPRPVSFCCRQLPAGELERIAGEIDAALFSVGD